MIRNARFWVSHNDGWVKLTLKPDQSLEVYQRHATDEGWSSSWECWTHQGDSVLRECEADGCDCDGRSSSSHEDECPLDQLVVVPHVKQCAYSDEFPDGWMPDDDAPLTPAWEKVGSRQRDYAAEAAGY